MLRQLPLNSAGLSIGRYQRSTGGHGPSQALNTCWYQTIAAPFDHIQESLGVSLNHLDTSSGGLPGSQYAGGISRVCSGHKHCAQVNFLTKNVSTHVTVPGLSQSATIPRTLGIGKVSKGRRSTRAVDKIANCNVLNLEVVSVAPPLANQRL